MNLKKVQDDPVVKKMEVEIVKALFWAFIVFQTLASVFVGFIKTADREIGFTFDGWGDQIVEQLFNLHFSGSGLLIFLMIFAAFFERFFIRDLNTDDWSTNQGSFILLVFFFEKYL